jgi:FeS assembly protein SufD
MSEPDWLVKLRGHAEKYFSELPLEKSKYTTLKLDFDSILKQRTNPQAQLPANVSALAEDGSRIIIVQLNDKAVRINLPQSLKKKGVILCSFEEALTKHSALIEDFFRNRIIKPEESKLAAFNYAYLSSGVFLYVPDSVKINKPIYHILALDGGSTITQTIIIAGKNSRFTFVEEDYSTNKEAFHSSLIELHLDEDAVVSFVAIQDFSQHVTSIVNKKARVEKGASINWILGQLGSGLSKARRDTLLVGQDASVSDIEVFFGRNSQYFDITSNIFHKVSHTKADVLVKGVLRDRARSISQGTIRVEKGAQKTDSFLAEHTMMLDKAARSDAIPSLEIEANDVRATHSASVSRIDEEQVFYLVSKGIGESEARKLIALGFLESAFQKIRLEEVIDRFKTLIEEKWENK